MVEHTEGQGNFLFPIFSCIQSPPLLNKLSTMLHLHFTCSVSVVSVCCPSSCFLILAEKEMVFHVMEGKFKHRLYGCNYSVHHLLQKNNSSRMCCRIVHCLLCCRACPFLHGVQLKAFVLSWHLQNLYR